MNDLIRMMRLLSKAGVTHFAVTDKLYSELKRHNEACNEGCGLGVDENESPLLFNGKPLLRKADVESFKRVSV